ncbi:MAG: hypothetical protein ACRDJW_09995 [Thermomicrobiales bacterium]
MPATPRRTAPTPTSDDGEATPSTGEGLHWGLVGAVLASVCCVGPLVAILVGVGGAAGAVGLVRFKWEFIAVGLVVTLVGVAISLRRSKARCSVNAYRRNRILIPIVSMATFLLLVVGSNVVLLNDRIIDAASSRLARETTTGAPERIAAPAAHQLDVEITSGVYCAACLLAIQQRVAETPGVESFALLDDTDGFVARIVYDPTKIDQARLLTTIASAPGAVGGEYGTKLLRDGPVS